MKNMHPAVYVVGGITAFVLALSCLVYATKDLPKASDVENAKRTAACEAIGQKPTYGVTMGNVWYVTGCAP